MWMWNISTATCMHVFTGHSSPVLSGSFTPDGKHIVSGSEDGTLFVWDPKTASTLFKLPSPTFHDGPITTIHISKDSTLALTGSQDSTAKLVNLLNGKVLAAFQNTQEESVESVAFCDSLPVLVTSDTSGAINLYNTTDYSLRQTLRHDDAVTKLRFRSNTPFLYSASVDKKIKVWDIRTGECVKEFIGHTNTVLDFDIDVDGNVISAGDDGVCLVFQL
jgi:ribosome assembly protein SQT1